MESINATNEWTQGDRVGGPRVGVAFFYHESHSFSPLATDLAAFDAEDHHLGARVSEAYTGTRTELGGFLDVLEARGAETVPLVASAAMPSGTVTAEAYGALFAEFAEALKAAMSEGPLDGLLLALHGSMVAETEQDPEGAVIGFARSLVGPDVPIAVTFDLHANVSARAAECGALIFGYQTYPHVDMYEQGVRAATALLDSLDGVALAVCTVRLPMLLRSINMRTAEGPMADVVDFARAREVDGVRAVSPHSGFPYSDSHCSGAGVSVVAATPEQSEAVAREVAEYFWQQRDRYQVDVPGVVEALESAREALIAGETPVVLADVADNPQSGGSADTTVLLRAVLEAGLGKLMFSAIYDSEVVAAAGAAGIGTVLGVDLAGKASDAFGAPLQVEAEVLAVSDGVFENDGPFNAGLTVDTGGAARLRLRKVEGIRGFTEAGTVDVVVTGRPITANDPALYRHLGIDPTDYDVLVWKVKNHFRAAFEPIVGRIIPVDAPGPAQTDFTALPFIHTDRTKWPFDLGRELGNLSADSQKTAPSFVIHPATQADLREVAEFHVDVWKEAYAGLMDAEFLQKLSVDRRLPEWEESLRGGPEYRIFVARALDGRFLGFGSVQDHEADGALALELHTLNLKPEARGTGLAASLLAELLGGRPAFAWVVDGNDRAVEFYRKAGFKLTDERRPDPESQVDDLRMIRSSQ
ncbi:MAG: GNAT family N-acetyltransferase [Leucobacter sp.]